MFTNHNKHSYNSTRWAMWMVKHHNRCREISGMPNSQQYHVSDCKQEARIFVLYAANMVNTIKWSTIKKWGRSVHSKNESLHGLSKQVYWITVSYVNTYHHRSIIPITGKNGQKAYILNSQQDNDKYGKCIKAKTFSFCKGCVTRMKRFSKWKGFWTALPHYSPTRQFTKKSLAVARVKAV